ncbi:hypothetical protein [Pukyongiella litopenaei]|uniref:Uncharacterized protein n=1 Tax=Pukyongiella litopenaei TaxID=2605946 RepID=A0A2S0MSG5_9RHOB|nr:hypothetical protein [Pukyongiella litopenaei]AVO38757.1 hypothetical protein C6Y53_14350 [Pukyongiella litopenaei]
MTAFSKYQRLEAAGLWRPAPDDQRREVIVSVGEATLTFTDFNDRPLTHWSLAAIDRLNPGEMPAIYCPSGDPDETLELNADQSEMIDAIERLRRAIDRARPQPGRLRVVIVLLVLAAVIAGLVLWLPGALRQHTTAMVPASYRLDVGEALLDRITRVAGRPCTSTYSAPALARLARRMEVARLVVLPSGLDDALELPGGIIVMSRSLFEKWQDPAVAAGFIELAKLRGQAHDPLEEVLVTGGIAASFRLLTTGQLSRNALDRHAEHVLVAPRAPVPDETLHAALARNDIPFAPYAMAVGLPASDATADEPDLAPVLTDADWVRLQGICAD